MRIALIPGVPALLPEYAGLEDRVSELRAASRAAGAWLVADEPALVLVVGDSSGPGGLEPLALRLARSLLPGRQVSLSRDQPSPEDAAAVLVVAGGSARRTTEAPGYLDDRAVPFDALVEQALSSGDGPRLAGIDTELAAELMVGGVEALRALGRLLDGDTPGTMDYVGDPYGVRYWVARWEVAR